MWVLVASIGALVRPSWRKEAVIPVVLLGAAESMWDYGSIPVVPTPPTPISRSTMGLLL